MLKMNVWPIVMIFVPWAIVKKLSLSRMCVSKTSFGNLCKRVSYSTSFHPFGDIYFSEYMKGYLFYIFRKINIIYHFLLLISFVL